MISGMSDMLSEGAIQKCTQFLDRTHKYKAEAPILPCLRRFEDEF